MKKIAIIALFFLSAGCLVKGFAQSSAPSAANCDLTTYPCAYSGMDVQQIPPAPFDALTPAGTSVRNTTLSRLIITRLTDANTICTGGTSSEAFHATPSGGDYDIPANVNSTLLAVRSVTGGSCVLGFNPNTFQPFQGASVVACGGGSNWSRVQPMVWYCRPGWGGRTPYGYATGTMIYAITFSDSTTSNNECGMGAGKCLDPSNATWRPFFDFASCPQASTERPRSGSILGIGTQDDLITSNISWAGGQDTARYVFAYHTRAKQCDTLDTQGDGRNPLVYLAGSKEGQVVVDGTTGEPLACTWSVHDSDTNGSFIRIGVSEPTGPGCAVGEGPILWQKGTNKVFLMGSFAPFGGHSTMTSSHFINDHIFRRPAIDPAEVVKIGILECSPCGDWHINANVNNDGPDYVLGQTDEEPAGRWKAPEENEILGFSQDGSNRVVRFSPTWSSGTDVTNFDGKSAIGAPSQDRKIWFFTSDMLCRLGKYEDGSSHVCRTDVFALDLVNRLMGVD